MHGNIIEIQQLKNTEGNTICFIKDRKNFDNLIEVKFTREMCDDNCNGLYSYAKDFILRYVFP